MSRDFFDLKYVSDTLLIYLICLSHGSFVIKILLSFKTFIQKENWNFWKLSDGTSVLTSVTHCEREQVRTDDKL